MKDIADKVLAVGDIVATTERGYTYTLIKCEVTGFTNKKVKLKMLESPKYTYYRSNPNIMKFPQQVAKI